MSQRSFAFVLLALVLVTFGGLVVYDMKSHNRIGAQKPSSNWRWSDEWNNTEAPVPVKPTTPQPPAEKPQQQPQQPTRPQGQIVASNYADAITKSRQYGMPVFVFLSADWCGYCTKMKQETLNDAQVKEIMKNYILVHVNTDQNRDVAQKFGVRVLPTFVVTNTTEKALKSGQGFQDAQTFAKWLNDPSLFKQQVQPENKPQQPQTPPQTPPQTQPQQPERERMLPKIRPRQPGG